jgi:type IV secretory pathway TrbL component
MTGGFFHGKGLQKGIIVISNPTSLLDRRDMNWMVMGLVKNLILMFIISILYDFLFQFYKALFCKPNKLAYSI